MRWRCGAPRIGFEFDRRLRKPDPRYLFAGGEIHDGEAIRIRELHKDAFGRAIRAGFDGHRAHAQIERQLPDRNFALEVDDRQKLGRNRAGDEVLAVRRHVDVVQPPVHRDALCSGQRACVDDVHGPCPARDADQDAIAGLGDGDVIGMIAQRHFLDERAARAVEDVERAVGLVADIDPRAVGRGRDPVRRLDALDFLHDVVGRRIDDVNAVAGAVGDIDESRTAPRRQRDECHHQPQIPHDATTAVHGNLPALHRARLCPTLRVHQGKPPTMGLGLAPHAIGPSWRR